MRVERRSDESIGRMNRRSKRRTRRMLHASANEVSIHFRSDLRFLAYHSFNTSAAAMDPIGVFGAGGLDATRRSNGDLGRPVATVARVVDSLVCGAADGAPCRFRHLALAQFIVLTAPPTLQCELRCR